MHPSKNQVQIFLATTVLFEYSVRSVQIFLTNRVMDVNHWMGYECPDDGACAQPETRKLQ